MLDDVDHALDIAILTNDPGVEQIYRSCLRKYDIPHSLHAGLTRYLVDGIKPGSFLTAVIENNLSDAALRADPIENLAALPHLARFLINETPTACHGSPAAVKRWIVARKQQKLAQKQGSE